MGVSRKYQNGKAGPPAVHTPSISNVVGGVGGWSTGSGSTMFAYISYQTTTSFVATLGQDSSSYTRARILCSAVGAFMIDILKHFDWHWGYSNTYYAYQSYETLPGGYSLRFGLATNCAARCTEPGGWPGLSRFGSCVPLLPVGCGCPVLARCSRGRGSIDVCYFGSGFFLVFRGSSSSIFTILGSAYM